MTQGSLKWPDLHGRDPNKKKKRIVAATPAGKRAPIFLAIQPVSKALIPLSKVEQTWVRKQHAPSLARLGKAWWGVSNPYIYLCTISVGCRPESMPVQREFIAALPLAQLVRAQDCNWLINWHPGAPRSIRGGEIKHFFPRRPFTVNDLLTIAPSPLARCCVLVLYDVCECE